MKSKRVVSLFFAIAFLLNVHFIKILGQEAGNIKPTEKSDAINKTATPEIG